MRREGWLSFYGISLLCVIGFYRLAFGIRIYGREHIPSEGSLILAANHVSYFDPPAVGAGLAPRHLSYFAKAELFRFKPFGWLIRNLNAFPVDRSRGDVAAIRRSVAILKEGRALLVFPEGGRNVTGQGEHKSGVAFLAKLSGAPVVPTFIGGTKSLRFRQRVSIAFGPPVTYDAALGKSAQAMAQWTTQLMEKIYNLETQCCKD